MFALPAKGFRTGQSELIENAPHYRVRDVVDVFRVAIKRRDSRQHDGPGFDQSDDIARLNETPGRFARDEDEFAAFLQKDISGAQECART